MKNTVHLIGNAHVDPVWLWRFPDGLAEIKATFRSALDRIAQFDDFIFTSACAFYYKWVEENCPSMFEEIRAAVKAGKWCVVGAMWVQPDCNIPSAESIARHLLYSQRYFEEKLGVRVRTGYNVDSFGHSGGLPRLLAAGGIENYVYMRPSEGDEKRYPFADRAFRWKCGENEVLAFRIPDAYCLKPTDDSLLKQYDAYAGSIDYDTMLFYGVGNHGGGPTVTNIRTIKAYEPENRFAFSDPDRFFDGLRDGAADRLPVYEGELQNHASGCYSANSRMKALNRVCENRLNEAERLSVLASCAGYVPDARRFAEAWQKVLFNQFHDIICGCSMKAAYDDAYAFGSAAAAHGLEVINAAAQRISWSIDTSKGVTVLSKDNDWRVWETDNLGTPVVVFNPLSHPVRVPVSVRLNYCAAVTDENDTPIPYQLIRAGYTNGGHDLTAVCFIAELPPCGWRTYWVYKTRSFGELSAPALIAEPHRLANDRITVTFDEATGGIVSMVTADGRSLLASPTRVLVIDDSANDTWAHNHFVFDNGIGEFGAPVFQVLESGSAQVSLKVTQTYKNSRLEQTYTLYSGDESLHVAARLILNEELVMVKLAFDTGLDGRFVREVPGGIVSGQPDGRELPMLRWMLMERAGAGLAVCNDSKYSASASDGELRMVIARSCYYGDHFGRRDGRELPQDIGEQEFRYVLSPFRGDMAAVSAEAERLNAVFPVITETYHKGSLPQTASHASVSDNAAITAIKPAEDGEGIIVRIAETAGMGGRVTASVQGVPMEADMEPYGIASFRIRGGAAVSCDFLE
ncbi:MAG: alpha-mannosidase [Clostridia bacterium]|nr:alpha-mannosidase [Clostridia bacterium]